MKKKFLVTQVANVRFYAKHKVLRELILLISQQLQLSVKGNINVFIGVHHWIADFIPREILNIGIQTEQFLDADGKQLWGLLPDSHLKAACLKFDVILDLSELNKSAYRDFDKYNRVVFGPYIFPSKKITAASNKSSEIYFVGALNERRAKAISVLSRQYLIKIVNNEFGEQLNQSLSRSVAILNIHFQDGVYAEWPRILLAYINGKILISEDLGFPLIKGRHYCSIGCYIEEVDFTEIHENIWQDLAIKYSFSGFINSTKPEKIKLKLSERIYLFRLSFILRLARLYNKLFI